MPAVVSNKSQGIIGVPSPVFSPIVEEGVVTAGGATSSPTYSLPEVVMPGELLLAFVGTDGNGETITFPTESPDEDGWIAINDGSSTSPNTNCSLAIWYKIADGSEDGGTVNPSISSTEESVGTIYAISQWLGIFDSGPKGGNEGGLIHTPPQLTMPINHYLVWTCCANDTTSSGSFPSDYTDNRINGSSGSTFGVRLRVCSKFKTGSSDQPGDFTTSNPRATELQTLGISPPASELSETPLTVRNPGADLDVSDWVDVTGAIGRRTANPTPFEGAGYFFGGTSAQSTAYQNIAIPSSLHSAVDNGQIAAVLEWYQNSFSGADDGEMWIEFYDDESPENQLGIRREAGITGPTVWTYRRLRHKAPTGARVVRIYMNMERDSGTDNDAYFDAITLKLVEAQAS